ncbi:MAG: hypothetical protein ACFE0K_11850, partial [Alcanivorax sp.]|uniref:hypothetical protein n=1 Tax=Alcanivorax sp. TaxID=1872427 RepID=UPI003DA748CB
MNILKAEPLPRYHYHDANYGFIDRILLKGERERSGFNRRMFDEDFSRLFHSINRRGGNLFKIVSNDDELMKRLLGNVKTRHASHSVEESIRKLVEEIARSLIWFGRAYFFLHDDAEQEKIHVASFSSYGVVRLFGTYVQ